MAAGEFPKVVDMAKEDGDYRCAMCGQPLAGAEAVCPHCDASLKEPGYLERPRPTRHTCPVCHGGFDDLEVVLLPESGPWYRLRTLRSRCPKCKTLLRSAHMTTKNMRRLRTVSFYTMVLAIFIPRDLVYFHALLFAVFGLLLCYASIMAYRNWRDPRLVVDTDD